jgi:DNA-binding response OmpR family regulator
VLLVDDEADVRLIAARVLGQFGVTPIVAENGDEALAALREIRRRGLGVKVLIMSGYSETETRARCASLDVAGFLPKPFEVDQLLAIIRPVLR